MLLLHEMGKDVVWLNSKLASTKVNIHDLILVTVTEKENVRVYSEQR